MIWDGTSPLRPEHEVAYRGWPTVRVTIEAVYPGIVFTKGKDRVVTNYFDGTYSRFLPNHSLDLIPLQQEPQK